MIRGVDVSSVQGFVPWDRVAGAGVRFAYLKCSQGNEAGSDPTFARNVAAAPDAGLVVGAYHFGYALPDNGTPGRVPVQQAQIAFTKANGLGARPGELPPCLDLEWPEPEAWVKWGCSAHEIADWGLEWLAEAERLWGVTPAVYIYPYFAASIGRELAADYVRYPLWIADYAHFAGHVPTDGAAPVVPSPWRDWTVWQHDGTGGLALPNGVDADFNVFHGDEAAFAHLLRQDQIASETAPAGDDPTGPA